MQYGIAGILKCTMYITEMQTLLLDGNIARRRKADRCQMACTENSISRAHSSRSSLFRLAAKIFLFLFIRNRGSLSPSRLSQRGASRSSRTLRRDAVGVSVLQRG